MFSRTLEEVEMAEEGSSEEYMEIVSNAEFLDGSVIFHLVRDSVGFVLYMHQQIPSNWILLKVK